MLLKIRNAKYRRLCEAEERDEDADGIPDIYEEDDPAYHLRMAAIHEKKAAEHRRIAEEKAAERGAVAQVPGGQAMMTAVRHDLTGRYKSSVGTTYKSSVGTQTVGRRGRSR